MRTLLITDLHLNSKIPGLLDSQVSCFHKILKDENILIRKEIIKYSLELKNLTSKEDKTTIDINILSLRER